MPEWKSRLAVSFTANNLTQTITPIDSFAPTFSLSAETLHSIERTHIGVIYSPQSITFSMTVKAIGPVVAQLTALALQGTLFDVILQETDGGDDWSFSSIVLTQCLISSAAPTTATIAGAPSATFSGFSLASTVSPKTGQPISIP
jgi:hypothetical protein